MLYICALKVEYACALSHCMKLAGRICLFTQCMFRRHIWPSQLCNSTADPAACGITVCSRLDKHPGLVSRPLLVVVVFTLPAAVLYACCLVVCVLGLLFVWFPVACACDAAPCCFRFTCLVFGGLVVGLVVLALHSTCCCRCVSVRLPVCLPHCMFLQCCLLYVSHGHRGCGLAAASVSSPCCKAWLFVFCQRLC